MVDDIADLYAEIHTETPLDADPLFSRPNFMARINREVRHPGFELVAVTLNGALVGFSFGYPFARGRWWAHSADPPREVFRASKFAVIELDVQRIYRGHGLGRRLLTELLASRTEQFATLAAIPDSPAQAMYLLWGWQKVGIIGGEGPVMDAMLLPLQA
jgi:GNAT superfamily N-acetyltransferase